MMRVVLESWRSKARRMTIASSSLAPYDVKTILSTTRVPTVQHILLTSS